MCFGRYEYYKKIYNMNNQKSVRHLLGISGAKGSPPLAIYVVSFTK